MRFALVTGKWRANAPFAVEDVGLRSGRLESGSPSSRTADMRHDIRPVVERRHRCLRSLRCLVPARRQAVRSRRTSACEGEAGPRSARASQPRNFHWSGSPSLERDAARAWCWREIRRPFSFRRLQSAARGYARLRACRPRRRRSRHRGGGSSRGVSSGSISAVLDLAFRSGQRILHRRCEASPEADRRALARSR